MPMGIFSWGIQLMVMVRMLDGADTQSSCREFLDQLHNQCRLSVVLTADYVYAFHGHVRPRSDCIELCRWGCCFEFQSSWKQDIVFLVDVLVRIILEPAKAVEQNAVSIARVIWHDKV